jgi:steroid 5-alpha reductase family enzyme
MEFLDIYFVGLLAVVILMAVLWLLSLFVRDSSLVDIFWGPGFMVTALVYILLTPEGNGGDRRLLIAALVGIWGLRLGLHVAHRNVRRGEDHRYTAWREEHGSHWWWRSLFQVFVLQGVLLWIVSAPLLAALHGPADAALGPLDGIAVAIWAVGFAFEAGGDWQLMRFKRDQTNRRKVMDRGLWRFTRHPNYFGDAVQWWAFWLIAVAAGGWWTVFSPVVMTFLLMRVSGVALLEQHLDHTRPRYWEYVQRTPAFIPWFPRRRRPWNN